MGKNKGNQNHPSLKGKQGKGDFAEIHRGRTEKEGFMLNESFSMPQKKNLKR